MDNFARAARPGISDETAMRLRGSALAAGRTYATALRYLRKPRPCPAARQAGQIKAPPAAAPQPPPAEPTSETQEVPPGFIALRPGATPIPAVFRPRDRFGNEIPDWRRRPDDPGAGTCRILLSARSSPGRRSDRRGSSDDGGRPAARLRMAAQGHAVTATRLI